MTISYVRPSRHTPKPAPAVQAAPVRSAARTDLAYWVDQYNRLTAQIQAAQVTNADPWKKESVNTRGLYSLRAAAAGRMAVAAATVLAEA